jgi:protein-tyrosine kinase
MRIISSSRNSKPDQQPESRATPQPSQAPPETGKPIGTLLVEAGHVTIVQVEMIAAEQQKTGEPFGAAGIRLGLLTNEAVNSAVHKQFGFHSVDVQDSGLHPSLVLARGGKDRTSEAIRSLRTKLLALQSEHADRQHTGLSITSVERRAGRSFFAANLAIAFAQAGFRTLLVDADMRHPVQHELFGIPCKRGLSHFLAQRDVVPEFTQVRPIPLLAVVPSGPLPPNPKELMSTLAARASVLQGAWQAQQVIYDTSALTDSDDAFQVGAATNDTLLVARLHDARLDHLLRAVGQSEMAHIRLAGIVINHR